jgi:hypothetical protein
MMTKFGFMAGHIDKGLDKDPQVADQRANCCVWVRL